MPLDVLMFQQACDQKPSAENAALYKSLMEEEFKEFIDAHWNRDETEMLDGCMDLSKAGEQGYAEAYEAIKKYCQ